MSLAMRKNTFEKKKRVSTGFCQVTPAGQPGFTGFFLIPVFCLTWTGPIIMSIGSQVNLSGRSGCSNYDIMWVADLTGYLVLA